MGNITFWNFMIIIQDINSREILYISTAVSFHSFDNFRPPPPPRRRMGGFRGGGGNDFNRNVWSLLRYSMSTTESRNWDWERDQYVQILYILIQSLLRYWCIYKTLSSRVSQLLVPGSLFKQISPPPKKKKKLLWFFYLNETF